MKNKTANGAARRTAKPTTARKPAPTDPLIAKWAREEGEQTAQQEAISEKYNHDRSVKLAIAIPPIDYGMLVGGAAVHKTTVEDLLAEIINRNVSEWANDGFYLED